MDGGCSYEQLSEVESQFTTMADTFVVLSVMSLCPRLQYDRLYKSR